MSSLSTGINSISTGINSISTTVSTVINDISSISTSLSSISGGKGIKYFHANIDENAPDSQAKGVNSIAIGSNAQANAINSVAIGNNSVANEENTVSFGGGSGPNLRLTHVADGVADTDAATVGQLKKTGLLGPDGEARTAVTYDVNKDGTTNYSGITLGSQWGHEHVDLAEQRGQR